MRSEQVYATKKTHVYRVIILKRMANHKNPAQTFESDGKLVSVYDLHKLPPQRHLRNADLNSRVPSGLFGTRETRANCRK